MHLPVKGKAEQRRKRVPQQDDDISKMRPDGKRPWRCKSSNLDETNQGKSSNLDETNQGKRSNLDEENQGRKGE